MPDSNLPASAGPDVTTSTEPTYDDHVEDISKLLSDPPAADPAIETEEAPAAETPAEDDDPLGMNVEAEAVEATDASEEDEKDGPQDYSGGRFAADDAKVRLDNGRVISVRDLKSYSEAREKEFQRGFTQKTQEAAEKERARQAELDQYAQSLDQFREFAAWYAETHLPKQPPAPPNDPEDYVAWHQYRLAKDQYDAHLTAYQTFQQQKQLEDQRKAGETAKEAEQRQKREAAAVLEAIPALKDPVKGKQVWDAIVAGAQQHYGASAEEVYRRSLENHKELLILRDALAYRRIKDKAPQVQAEVGRRPPLKEGRRAPPNQQQTREKQALSERARTGNFDAGVALLSKLNI